MNDKYLTVKELAEYLNIGVTTIYNMLAQGKIPAAKVFGQWRFKKDDIDDWFRSQYRMDFTNGSRVPQEAIKE